MASAGVAMPAGIVDCTVEEEQAALDNFKDAEVPAWSPILESILQRLARTGTLRSEWKQLCPLLVYRLTHLSDTYGIDVADAEEEVGAADAEAVKGGEEEGKGQNEHFSGGGGGPNPDTKTVAAAGTAAAAGEDEEKKEQAVVGVVVGEEAKAEKVVGEEEEEEEVGGVDSLSKAMAVARQLALKKGGKDDAAVEAAGSAGSAAVAVGNAVMSASTAATATASSSSTAAAAAAAAAAASTSIARLVSAADRLMALSAAPFTVQRICEVLCDPKRHFSSLQKAVNALVKLTLVSVTLATPAAAPIFGLDTASQEAPPRESDIRAMGPVGDEEAATAEALAVTAAVAGAVAGAARAGESRKRPNDEVAQGSGSGKAPRLTEDEEDSK